MNKPKWTWNWHYLWQAPFYLFGWGMIGYIIIDLAKVATRQQPFDVTELLTDFLILGLVFQKVWPKNLHRRILYFGIFGVLMVILILFFF